jgi:hypothetical protein
MKRHSDLRTTVAGLFSDLPRAYQERLRHVADSPYATADTAACLLGRDLWLSPLTEFRDRLIASGERPHLWTFEFGRSCAWDAARWNSLSLQARILRARAGSVDRPVVAHISPWALRIDARPFKAGLSELAREGICRNTDYGPSQLEPIATPEELYVDLSLVEILSHWLWMLAHRDRVLADRHATGFEVYGYLEACSDCRVRWGLRPRAAPWVPPFHPGCRCFAQPRFTDSS